MLARPARRIRTASSRFRPVAPWPLSPDGAQPLPPGGLPGRFRRWLSGRLHPEHPEAGIFGFCRVWIMFAVTAARIDAEDPLAGLELGERPDPVAPDGWTTVTVKAAALNHHDVWTLRGVGISADRLPIVLGCDVAGFDAEGNEVVVHAVISENPAGDETMDPARSLLSERYDGTFAERVAVPRRNLVPKPAGLSFAEAAGRR